MSDTPRTDAAVNCDGSHLWVKPDFTRQLERELAEARATVEELHSMKKDAQNERDAALAACAEMRAALKKEVPLAWAERAAHIGQRWEDSRARRIVEGEEA